MKKAIALLFVITALCPLRTLSQQKDSLAMAKIRTMQTGKNLTAQWEKISTEKSLLLLQKDGSFSDGIPDKKHITGRIMQWVIDYQRRNYSNRRMLRESIYKSLQYWLTNHPGYEFPSIPFETLRSLAAIELVLYNDMMKDRSVSKIKRKEIDSLIQSITRFSHWCWLNGKSKKLFDKNDGHNRGGNVGYRLWAMTAIASCSGKTSEMDWVHQIVKEQFPRVLNTSYKFPTGFTPDGSWIQHNAGGAQNYWIGYGVHWIKHVLDYAEVIHDTPWVLSNTEWNTIVDYYLDGIQWLYYNNHGALNLAGRHNALKEAPMDNGEIRKSIGQILELGDFSSSKKKELKKTLKRFQYNNFTALDSCKYFWNTDLLIHSTPTAYFAIKMLSNRTTGCETSENERAHGKNNFFSGDGSSLILRTGNEYDKARIGWNWRAWPGITALQKTGKLPLSPWGKESTSSNSFAGGLSTGYEGIAAFQYNRENEYVNLKANKAYFSFGNQLLALGNGIHKKQADAFDVWTTINQAERHGDIQFCINGTNGVLQSSKSEQLLFKNIAQISWVYHDSIGYVIIPGKKKTDLKIFGEKRTGNWTDLDGRYASEKDSTNIFQLSILHGDKPENSYYSYLILPCIATEQLQHIIQNKLPVVIQNNETVQAIEYQENQFMLVFYQAGRVQISGSHSISVDAPAILHLRKKGKNWYIQASDPLQKQEKTELTISSPEQIKSQFIYFPNGMNVGESTTIQIKF